MAQSSRVPLFFLCAVFCLLGTLFVYLAGNTLLEERHYQRGGIRTPAVALGKSLERATADTDTAYKVSYRVTPAAGAPLDVTETVGVHLWERVERGAPLVVEFVPGPPATARIVQDRSEGTLAAYAWLALGLALIAIGVLIATKGGRWIQTGDAAPAEHTAEPSPAFATDRGFRPDAGAGSARGPGTETAWAIARRSAFLWLAGIFLTVGVPFAIAGAVMVHGVWEFASDARVIEGIALAKEIRRTSSGSGSSRRPVLHYEVDYRYTADGRTFEGRDELSSDAWQAVVERAPIAVRYLPHRPESSRLAAGSRWGRATIFALVGAILTSLGGVSLFRVVRNARREVRLRQGGVRIEATVTELRARNLHVNNVQQWHLGFAYRDYQGGRHEDAITIPADEAQQWKVGDVGTVLYDSARPDQAVWIGRGR